MVVRELDIVRSIISWMLLSELDLSFRQINTSGIAVRNRRCFRRNDYGVGVPDLIVALPNQILFVEVKTKNGRLTEHQKWFFERWRGLGHECHVVQSLEEFQELVLKHYKQGAQK